MKTKKIIFACLLGIGLLGTACTNFDSINENPNDATENMYDFDKGNLGKALRNGGVFYDADVQQRIKALGMDVFAQYVGGNSTARVWTPNDGWLSLYWNNYYTDWFASLNIVIANAQKYEGRQNSLALGRIWRVYMQSQFTDFYGPAPFPKSPEDTNPDYESLDKQYEFFFKELDESVKLFDSSKDFLTVEDQIYYGNIAKWKRFANTLRLRLAIKMSEINPELCKTQAQAAYNADGGIMISGDDAALPGVSGVWGQQYVYYMYQVGWSDRQVMMKTMEKILTGIGGMAYAGTAAIHPEKVDPRGERYFDPSPETNTWAGLKAGIQTEPAGERNRVSAMSRTWIIPNDNRKTDLFLYSEACFLMAEAVERGFVIGAGSAKDWYEKGVKASFAKWSLSDSQAVDYLVSNDKNLFGTSANYDDTSGNGNTKLEKIITQKYISHYIDLSRESWNDKRRLNLPAMDIPEYRDPGAGTYPNDGNIKNPSNFISRMVYPQSEALNNKSKYEAGVAQLTGGDKTSSPIWWATKKSNYCTSN